MTIHFSWGAISFKAKQKTVCFVVITALLGAAWHTYTCEQYSVAGTSDSKRNTYKPNFKKSENCHENTKYTKQNETVCAKNIFLAYTSFSSWSHSRRRHNWAAPQPQFKQKRKRPLRDRLKHELYSFPRANTIIIDSKFQLLKYCDTVPLIPSRHVLLGYSIFSTICRNPLYCN